MPSGDLCCQCARLNWYVADAILFNIKGSGGLLVALLGSQKQRSCLLPKCPLPKCHGSGTLGTNVYPVDEQ